MIAPTKYKNAQKKHRRIGGVKNIYILGGVNVLNGGVITTIKDVIYIYETNIKDICNFWGDPCLWVRQGHMKKRMVSTVFTQSIN